MVEWKSAILIPGRSAFRFFKYRKSIDIYGFYLIANVGAEAAIYACRVEISGFIFNVDKSNLSALGFISSVLNRSPAGLTLALEAMCPEFSNYSKRLIIIL